MRIHTKSLCFSKISRFLCGVITLTLVSLPWLTGCSVVQDRYGERCKTHTHVRVILSDYLSSRFHQNSPVRMAVIPFSVPANISVQHSDLPGLGNQLAWSVHARLLETELIPIVEVLNRHDWPGKRDEFFTGNFGALSIAREAGYDLVLVGYVPPPLAPNHLSAHTKIIEVESGITLWYGETEVNSIRDLLNPFASTYFSDDRVPNRISFNAQTNTLAKCIAKGVTSDKLEL